MYKKARFRGSIGLSSSPPLFIESRTTSNILPGRVYEKDARTTCIRVISRSLLQERKYLLSATMLTPSDFL